MPTNKKPSREDAAKREMTKTAGRDDVHEQREPGQTQEGVVTKAPAEEKPKRAKRAKR